MINPQPINERRSPYSTGSNFPKTTPVPPKNDVPPSKKPRRLKKVKRIIGFTVLTLVIATSTYVYAQYHSLKTNVLVEHQGESSAILSYDPANKSTKLDASLFTKTGDGRFNVVIVGIGGDGHSGGGLTDSIQVASIDTINKKIDITSIPRDLYVNIPGYGRTKINATYEVGEARKAGDGALLLRQVIENVIGVKVSNFALFDFSGFKDIVDSVGGVDVTVPYTIYDPEYPAADDIHFDPFYITAGPHHMDGATALKYARTRHVDSDFGRSGRQHDIMQAIKVKSLSAGVITNPLKVSNLVTALGQHFKTDLTTDQLKALLGIYKDITPENTTGHVLDTSDTLGLLTSTTDPVAGYISYPWTGYDKFDAVHEWYIKNTPDPLEARENPTITLVGTSKATPKQLQTELTLLKDYGYNAVLGSQTVSSSTYTKTTFFQTKTGKDKPISTNYLGSLLSITPQSGSPLSSTSDFEIVYVP
jgi:LCP family protein required for cell wall assembly